MELKERAQRFLEKVSNKKRLDESVKKAVQSAYDDVSSIKQVSDVMAIGAKVVKKRMQRDVAKNLSVYKQPLDIDSGDGDYEVIVEGETFQVVVTPPFPNPSQPFRFALQGSAGNVEVKKKASQGDTIKDVVDDVDGELAEKAKQEFNL